MRRGCSSGALAEAVCVGSYCRAFVDTIVWRIEQLAMGLVQSQEQRGQLTKIERRMVQAMAERAQKANVTLKTFNTFILKFPKIDASFEAVREVFNKADKNGDGSLDMDELKQCLQELQVEYSDQEVEEFHHESDMDSSHGIQFKEFIVVLALIYLLGLPTHTGTESAIGLPDLEHTFDEIAEAFVFFDRNKDGYVSKKEMIWAINEASPSGRQGHKIGVQRFEEMDWDKDGMITFKEFLFAFTDWVGLENDEEESGHNKG